MTLVFPRQMTVGWNWEIADLDLLEGQELSRDSSGVPRARSLADPVWTMRYRSEPVPLERADELHADFQSLSGSLRSFYAHTARRPHPRSITYPGTWDFSSLVVSSIGANFDTLVLSGSQPGLRITRGDYLTIVTPSGRELHKFVESGSDSDLDGILPELTVVPHIRQSVTPGDQVILVNPYMEAVLRPGTLEISRNSGNLHSVSFSAVQVVR